MKAEICQILFIVMSRTALIMEVHSKYSFTKIKIMLGTI
jgi:hypothetical protein